MMGVGKSTVGKILSKRLKMDFLDVDKLIEKNQKMPIKKIFGTKGERFFRNIEKNLTLKSIKKLNCVIALGGGAFMSQEIRHKILQNCSSFYLELKNETLLKRVLLNDNRPLLSNSDIKNQIKELYTERVKIYKKAHHKIDCNNLNKYQVVNKILKLYEKSWD